MKVWVLTAQRWGVDDIVEVFTSEQLADLYVEKNLGGLDDYEINEREIRESAD